MKEPNLELSKPSWEKVSKYYRKINTTDAGSNMYKLIEVLIEKGLDSSLFASNSHNALNISAHDRYDAKCDVLRLEYSDAAYYVEYFSYDVSQKKHDLKLINGKASKDEVIQILSERKQALISSLP